MAITPGKIQQPDDGAKTRRLVFIVAGVIAVILVGGLILYLKTRPEPQPTVTLDEKLDGGIRAGSPEFERYRELIKLDEPEADYSSSVAGGIAMTLGTTVRNFTGKTITGLEIKGSVISLDDKPIKDRTLIVIPSRVIAELENNHTALVPILIPGFKGEEAQKIESGQAKLKMEVTAIRLK